MTFAILLIASLIRLVTVEIPRRHRHLPVRELPAFNKFRRVSRKRNSLLLWHAVVGFERVPKPTRIEAHL
jgi:hypothetical protein